MDGDTPPLEPKDNQPTKNHIPTPRSSLHIRSISEEEDLTLENLDHYLRNNENARLFIKKWFQLTTGDDKPLSLEFLDYIRNNNCYEIFSKDTYDGNKKYKKVESSWNLKLLTLYKTQEENANKLITE